jgi:hypothetical protein
MGGPGAHGGAPYVTPILRGGWLHQECRALLSMVKKCTDIKVSLSDRRSAIALPLAFSDSLKGILWVGYTRNAGHFYQWLSSVRLY